MRWHVEWKMVSPRNDGKGKETTWYFVCACKSRKDARKAILQLRKLHPSMTYHVRDALRRKYSRVTYPQQQRKEEV